MIQSLSDKYKRHITWPLFIIFYVQFLSPLYAAGRNFNSRSVNFSAGYNRVKNPKRNTGDNEINKPVHTPIANGAVSSKPEESSKSTVNTTAEKLNIGGPTSPEASSFKAVGGNNLVNLFTGDFSYSIPLLDVGGYPVNLFYNGGIGMEHEASWVGLGWNINPGTVNRSMRGVPDDFDGTDLLKVNQNVRPNRTFGGEIGGDVELFGFKTPRVSLNSGVSYNNYLGPEVTMGAKLSLTFSMMELVGGEKKAMSSPSITTSLGAKLSSRSGLTLSPSLSANISLENNKINQGIGLSTSYNSRTGMKELNISGSTTYSKDKDLGGPRSVGSPLSLGKSISFAKPSYIPTIRMPMAYFNASAQMEFGIGAYGWRGSVSGMGNYAQSIVPEESRVVTKPLVGYMYSEKANTNENAVMDFNRLGDAEVTPNTPVISAPQYNYDIFSIQGEGTGGTIRAYRGDMGFMRDNVTTSKDLSIAVGVDIALPGHYGGNYNIISTPTRVGGWKDHTNTLLQTMSFKSKQANSSFENVYFRNPGETTVTNPDVITRIGEDNLVRFQLGGTQNNVTLLSNLELSHKKTGSKKGIISVATNTNLLNREKRTQVTTMITAGDATRIGLETSIRNYTGTFNNDKNIVYDTIGRVGGFRKQHHISEIDVLEQNGMRYVYGLPVYNIKQKDFTFTVKNNPDTNNLVGFLPDEPTINSDHLKTFAKMHGYVQSQETPAYAASFLITGLLSPDYVDVTSNGITEDDLGTAVKFDYSKSDSVHRWRTPRNNGIAKSASFNEGIRTEKKDNKAMISYGEREVWYLKAIESKSMVAIFKTDVRNDAKGVIGELDGRIHTTENANKKLTQIDLYTKAEIKAKGIDSAKPLKSVFFVYDYSLCTATPDNNGGGKLTLKEVYFTYNGQIKSKDRYVFGYNADSTSQNPSYAYNASDRWGTYKNHAANPSGLPNVDYPYALTGSDKKKLNDQFAGAWSLKKILLPSGGQMEMKYEADDYAYTQDRRACTMFNIYGFGNTRDYVNSSSIYRGLSGDNYYIYIKLPKALENTDTVKQKAEIYAKYLEGIHQLAFKLQINMPDGPEPLTCYADYDYYGVCTNSSGNDYIYIHLVAVDGKSPLAKSAISFLTNNIPGQAFDGYDVDITSLTDFIAGSVGMLTSLTSAFTNVDQQMRLKSSAKTVVLANSFIRLNNPEKMKFGGGARIKQVIVKDNWNKMTGQYNSMYGQDYDYTTIEKIDGKEVLISSGVASYEPGIGSEENPFREIIQFNNKLPLAPAEYGAVEMPILEGLYPSPGVGYSKVTVRSIHRRGTHGDSSLRSAIGKQVSEFYTAREFPSYSTQTGMDSREYNKDPFFSFLYKEIKNHRTISQGFLVETNDMHGKMKSQAAYSESDEKTPLSASYHTYRNTGKNGLNDKVDFVYGNEGGAVHQGNMGVDMELMTDIREFSIKSKGINGQIQTDLLFFTLLTIPIPTFLPLISVGENRYRAVTCTKLINYHAIEDSVIVMDKGSVISTKTIAYDAETGAPIVTKTANEFNDPIYNVSYPAYWAYSGTEPAYKNINMNFEGVNFYDGQITSGVTDMNVFESGDELYVYKKGTTSGSCLGASADLYRLWAFDKNKDTTALTVTNKNFIFMDADGRPFTQYGVNFKIIRSGKRNNMGLTISAATCMQNPLQNNQLVIVNSAKVISASAIEYKEKWQIDNGIILKKSFDACSGIEYDDCHGYLQTSINPYLKGLIGNFKPHRSYTYYGTRNETNVNVTTTIRKNGYISEFTNYWNFNDDNNLVHDFTNTKWVYNSELTKVNSKGQELETKDALNRYTSAQYGFNKNLPVAITNNAQYGEIASEGFEDYNYEESINAQGMACNTRHIDLMSNNTFGGGGHNPSNFIGAVVSTDTMNFKAHTGKQILRIAADGVLEKQFAIKKGMDTFSLLTIKDTSKVLSQPGVNSEIVDNVPGSSATVDADVSNFGVHLSVNHSIVSSTYNLGYLITTSQYAHIQQNGYYPFSITGLYDYHGGSLGFEGIYAILTVKDSSGNEIYNETTDYLLNGQFLDSVDLCKGIYLFEMKVIRTFGPNFPAFSNVAAITHTYLTDRDAIWFSFTRNYPISYKNLNKDSGCIYAKSIPGKDSMINPIFQMPSNKRMLFSAWVREDCGVPCYKTTYSKSHIGLSYPGSANTDIVSIIPAGPIVEGWQKVEGEFTVPADATSVNLKFSNDSTQKVYFDDIRIHPFNANMKSYVYDPRSLRLSAELDENNYASFYEYDEEGQLVRVKKETVQGIKTIKETRSAKQKAITNLQ